jgi:WD40 repeat protein
VNACIHRNSVVCQHTDTFALAILSHCTALFTTWICLGDNLKHTKVNLNTGSVGPAAFDEHVSFAVMDMKPWQDKYLALATDNSRNIIMDVATGKQVRNLYGHSNDGYSHPKVAWSQSGQYLMGNTQEDGSVCVWDIASSSIVQHLKGHGTPVRDIYSSPTSDTMVTTAFDKATRFWFAPTTQMV